MLEHPVAVRAERAANMTATLSDVRPMRYRAAHAGLPDHVRSASGLCRWQGRLVIVQDDVRALAMLDQDGTIEPLLLPGSAEGPLVFDDAHGNKAGKLDLESVLSLPDGRLLALGSGATAQRECLVLLSAGGAARIVDAAALYAVLRANNAFAGTELNLEGAAIVGDSLRLFQRGNGGRSNTGTVASATGDITLPALLDWLDRNATAPALSSVQRVDLGSIRGVPFGFTDASTTPDGHISFLACAEDSADAVSDGPVLGCRFGLATGARFVYVDILDEAGCPVDLKLEGISARDGEPGRYDVVADQDRPDEPALRALLTVARR